MAQALLLKNGGLDLTSTSTTPSRVLKYNLVYNSSTGQWYEDDTDESIYFGRDEDGEVSYVEQYGTIRMYNGATT